MAIWSRQPVATDSAATSQPLISGCFIQIEGVLGSSTLSAGITKVAGDTLYASDAQTIVKLAKASASGHYLSSDGTSQNPSWAALSNIVTLAGLKSAASLQVVGNILEGTWSGTAITPIKGGTGVTIVNRGVVNGTGAVNVTATFTTAFADTNYNIASTFYIAGWSIAGSPVCIMIAKNAANAVFASNGEAGGWSVEYIAMGV